MCGCVCVCVCVRERERERERERDPSYTLIYEHILWINLAITKWLHIMYTQLYIAINKK